MTAEFINEIYKFASASGATLSLLNLLRVFFKADKTIYGMSTGLISAGVFVMLIYNYIDLAGGRWDPHFVELYFCAAIMIMYPGIYLFFILSVDPEYKFTRRHWFFFLSPPLILLLGLPAYYYGVEKWDRHPLAYYMDGRFEFSDAALMSCALAAIPYFYLIVRRIRHIFTTRAAKNLELAYVHILYFVVILVIFITAILAIPTKSLTLIRIVAFLATVAVFLRLLFSLQYPNLFEQIGVAIERGSYKQSTLTGLDTDAIGEQLSQLMESEKVYTNESLNLASLAEMMDLKRYQLTEYLNVHKNTNFPLLINQYRVSAAAELLRTEKNAGIMNIAYRVGFNSKSAFNAAFRKVMDCTPTEYVRRQFG